MQENQNLHAEGDAMVKDPGPSFLQGLSCGQFGFRMSDHHSSAHMNATFFVPDFNAAGISSDYYFVGAYGVRDLADPPPGTTMVYRAVNDDPNSRCFMPPAGFTRIWSKSNVELHIWAIIPPAGYIGIGCVYTAGDDPGPNSMWYYDRLMCVRQDLCTQTLININSSNLVWNDRGSGAQTDATVVQLPNSRAAYAVGYYPDMLNVWDVKPQ